MFGIIKFTRNSLFIYNHKTLVIIIVSCFRSLLRLNLGYVGFHSIATATCRYVFVMYDIHDEYTSVRKIRKFFITISFIVPIILWFLNEALIDYPEVKFPMVGSPTHAQSKLIVQLNLTDVERTFNSTIYTQEQPSFLIPHSPLFLIVEKYVSSSILSGFKITSYFVQSILYSNIPEGVLYTHLFIVNSR